MVRGVTVYDDFAHHPSAVRAALAGVRAAAETGRIWALFEPRSATACRRVFQEPFADALGQADEVIIGAVFRASIPDDERLSETQLAADLVAGGTRARHLSDVSETVSVVAAEARPGDHIVVMSNGAFGGIHQRLLDRLAG